MDLLDVFFPKKCVGCGKTGGYVCRECELGMWEEEQICPNCCRPSRYGARHAYCRQPWSMEGLTCFWAYDGITRRLITKAKYNYLFDYLKYCSIFTAQYLLRPEFAYFRQFIEQGPMAVPVPLFKKRLRERGFNQAEVIARQVARSWILDESDLLIRIKDTGRQVGRNKEERLKAMEGAFEYSRCKIQDSIPDKVLLVDDVWTTGATMRECVKVLKQAGVRRVWGLILAR